MPFHTPNLNILCNIYTGPPPLIFPGPAPRLANVACQLRMLKTAEVVGTLANPAHQSQMLLAIGASTDIRMVSSAGNDEDYVEVPAGTGRYYAVIGVDDVAKGFPNEYRAAAIRSLNGTPGAWPRPYP